MVFVVVFCLAKKKKNFIYSPPPLLWILIKFNDEIVSNRTQKQEKFKPRDGNGFGYFK